MRRVSVTSVALVAGVLAFALQFAPDVAAQQRGAGPPPAPFPAQPAKGTGLISGRVVDAATDQPIDAAVVTIVGRMQAPTGAPAPARGAAPNQTRLLTGSDGRFVLHDLPPGSFTLNVTAPGYVSGSYGQAQASGPGQPITLADAERVTDAKIRLWKTAVLTGTVLDDAGEPAVGIRVHASRRVAVAGRVRYSDVASGMTDDRGAYRLTSLTPGEFIVFIPQTQTTMPVGLLDTMLQAVTASSPIVGASMISELVGSSGPSARGSSGVRVGDSMLDSDNGAPVIASDGRVLAYQSAFFPSATSPLQATAITLRSGEERSGADLQLRVVPTVRVSGIVTTPTGPSGMTSVRLMAAASDSTSAGFDSDVGNTTTRGDGTFTFLGIPPGQYVARVYKPPRPPIPPELASNPMVQTMLGGPGGSAVALYGDAPVNVGGGDVDGVSIALTPGVKLSGRIEFVGTSPQPTAQQLGAMTITVRPADGNRMGGILGSPNRNALNAQGEFALAGYPPGMYLFSATTPGQGWLVKSITAEGRDVVRRPLEVKDADISGIVITFTDKVGRVSGAVHGLNNATPLPGAMVFLWPADYRDWIANSDGSPIRTAPVVRGYSISGLIAGDYLMAALDGPDVPEGRDMAFFDALARVATHVTLADGDQKTIELTTVKIVR